MFAATLLGMKFISDVSLGFSQQHHKFCIPGLDGPFGADSDIFAWDVFEYILEYSLQRHERRTYMASPSNANESAMEKYKHW